MKSNKKLSELATGECARISALNLAGSMRRRLLDIGMSPGTAVRCVGQSPFKDPKVYLVRGCAVAIRGKDADRVIIE